jgi:hypothetical protein
MSEQERAALEQALRDFEPVFYACPWGEPQERLYEPDGTLYAICLDGPVVVATDRRQVKVHAGDLVILPPAVAVELSATSRWFGIVYTGPYPYHFRERFIQVWGFEHVPFRPGRKHDESEASHSAASRDLRHRIYPAFGDYVADERSKSPEFVVAIRLEPDDSEGFRVEWARPRESLVTNHGAADSNRRSIVFEIPTEAVYLTHREATPAPVPSRTMSPEYRPEA